MVHEPETGACFQYKVSLKSPASKPGGDICMLRVDEHYHAEFGAIEFGRNEGIRGGSPQDRLIDEGADGNLRLHRGGIAQPAVSEVEQRTKGYCTPVLGNSDGAQPGTDDAFGGMLDKTTAHPRREGRPTRSGNRQARFPGASALKMQSVSSAVGFYGRLPPSA